MPVYMGQYEMMIYLFLQYATLPYLTYRLPLLKCYHGAGRLASHEVSGFLALETAAALPRGPSFADLHRFALVTSADSEQKGEARLHWTIYTQTTMPTSDATIHRLLI